MSCKTTRESGGTLFGLRSAPQGVGGIFYRSHASPGRAVPPRETTRRRAQWHSSLNPRLLLRLSISVQLSPNIRRTLPRGVPALSKSCTTTARPSALIRQSSQNFVALSGAGELLSVQRRRVRRVAVVEAGKVEVEQMVEEGGHSLHKSLSWSFAGSSGSCAMRRGRSGDRPGGSWSARCCW